MATDRRSSNTQLLEELEELSQSLYQTHTSSSRRTASLVLPRTSVPSITSADEVTTAKIDEKSSSKPRSRRMSLSPWRSRAKPDEETERKTTKINQPGIKKLDDRSSATERKGIWNWKPIRAISHIGMQKLSCLFSVEVVAVQGLPASMNGLRLSVCVRKKETKDGAIMEKEGGIDIYSQAEGSKTTKFKNFSSSLGRKQSKSSFSVSSPRMTLRSETWTPSQTKPAADIQGMDDLNLDETAPVPSPPPSIQKSEEPEQKIEDLDLPDFEIVDKGVEIQDKEDNGDGESEENVEEKSQSSEVVKEIVHDQVHLTRLTELDSIAQQIKVLESMMEEEKTAKTDEETESQKLDADEETVTKEFLQMLEDEETNLFEFNQPEIPTLHLDGGDDSTEAESKVYLSDLGKGLGCVVQTRDGGYLAATNPLDSIVSRKDTPKLAMQLSKPLVLQSDKSMNGFELFQRMASIGFEELCSQILSLMPLDELLGKTAEQIAFEGIASAIIQGRNKEGASSSAARTIAAVKTMATAMSTGRKERISTGIWNVNENPLTAEEVLAFSLQKIELRDPIRRYEAVGGPVVALVHATQADIEENNYNEEKKFKVTSLHVGGMKGKSGRKRNLWDSERQRLTATQWLVAYGLGKAGKKGKHVQSKGKDFLWSISSRIMADMWLKPMRNPDVKFTRSLGHKINHPTGNHWCGGRARAVFRAIQLLATMSISDEQMLVDSDDNHIAMTCEWHMVTSGLHRFPHNSCLRYAETKILEGCPEIPLCNLHELSICQQVTKARGHRINNLVFLVKEFLTQYGHSTVNSFSELNLLSFDWPQNHAMFQQLLGLDNDHKDSRKFLGKEFIKGNHPPPNVDKKSVVKRSGDEWKDDGISLSCL
ncbi:hypothetical protein D5086_011754 [Populus alba]|uniref:Uncharacterized protein n=1 Tax=Populus alba TaxID=43335 RepID=A0ACC4CDG0_POPAL